MSNDKDSENEDTIIEEIPIFLSKPRKNDLFLLQFPTKTRLNYNDETVVNSCVKPINQEIKIDFGLDVESHYIDSFKAEQMAIMADGKTRKKGERPSFKHGVMDKQAFVSSRVGNDVSKYCIAILQDKEMHFAPMKNILQMRPSFSHFDKEDKRNKAAQKDASEDGDNDIDGASGVSGTLQQVNVKFSRNTNVGNPAAAASVNKSKAKSKQGFNSYMKRRMEEPWCETFYHSCVSSKAELERQKMLASTREQSNVMSLSPESYLSRLFSKEQPKRDIDKILPARAVNKGRLKTLPLMEQLKTLLKDAKMLSFSEILSFLRNNIDSGVSSEKVLSSLLQIGVMLRGNWTLQSDVLYPTKMVSNANGVPAELLVRARDYLIYRFSRVSHLYRPQVIAATQLPPEEALEVLSSIAKLTDERKWELLLPPDKSFEEQHSDIQHRQELIWQANEQLFNEMDTEKSSKRARKRSIRSDVSKATQQQQQQQQNLAATISTTTDITMTEIATNNKTHNVSS